MLKVLFYTYHSGHLVSGKEYARMAKGLSKVGVSLIMAHKDTPATEDFDLIMVKGFSHTWQEIVERNPLEKPVVYLSIGTEWKVGATPALNEPIKELYLMADHTVHISQYCMDSHHAIFPLIETEESVIIPAEEPKLRDIKPMHSPLKLAMTCIPRPVKRAEQTQELCAKYGIELVPAWGGVEDFSYYYDCDGYIHLSRKEGMPNTVLEAMAYGLPCIVTNYGGAHEAVGDAGIVIKNDPEGVAWDPDNILPVDEELFKDALGKFERNYNDLRLKTRERVLSKLNDYVAACKFKKVFESVL